LIRKPDHALAGTGGEVLDEIFCQQQNVRSTRPQRRHFDDDDVKTIKQIFTKPAIVNRGFQIAVGGGNDARLKTLLGFAAERTNAAFLERPQLLGLQRQRHLADFVEKERSAIRLQQQTFVIGLRVGECAALVTEKLALQKRFRQRRAIDGHKRPAASAAPVVQSVCDQLFADAAFSGDQNRAFRIGDASQLRKQLTPWRAVTDQLIKALRLLDDLAECLHFLLQGAVSYSTFKN
jgi:hypothetical protein